MINPQAVTDENWKFYCVHYDETDARRLAKKLFTYVNSVKVKRFSEGCYEVWYRQTWREETFH